jgi:LytR cell envelope-related transcriptional attenuator
MALLGIAAVALVIGAVTVIGGGDGRADGNPPGQTSSADGGDHTTKPKPKPTTTRPPATTTTTKPTTTTTTKTSAPDDTPGTSRLPLRVYNNSKIHGLADDAAADFRAGGWEVSEVGNYGTGIIPTTTVYFRQGTAEEAPARELAAQFGMRAEARFEGIEDARDGIIVIVTKDYQGQGNQPPK